METLAKYSEAIRAKLELRGVESETKIWSLKFPSSRWIDIINYEDTYIVPISGGDVKQTFNRWYLITSNNRANKFYPKTYLGVIFSGFIACCGYLKWSYDAKTTESYERGIKDGHSYVTKDKISPQTLRCYTDFVAYIEAQKNSKKYTIIDGKIDINTIKSTEYYDYYK